MNADETAHNCAPPFMQHQTAQNRPAALIVRNAQNQIRSIIPESAPHFHVKPAELRKIHAFHMNNSRLNGTFRDIIIVMRCVVFNTQAKPHP